MRFSLKLISREIDHYQLGFEVFLFAKHLIQHHRHFLGEKVRIIAGSALIIALDYLKHPIKLSAFQISKDFGVSASTVYTRKNKFPYHRIDWIPQSSVPRVYPQLHHAKINWIGNNRQITKGLSTQVSLNNVSPHMEINNFLPS